MAVGNFQRIDRSVGYTVKDIATPSEDLLCWSLEKDQREAIVQQARVSGISFLPVKQNDVIVGVIPTQDLEAGKRHKNLKADLLIAADTPILHLIELFVRYPDKIFLVLQSSDIKGLVAPADLNKVPARASVYLLVAHFEASLADLIQKVVGEEEEALEPYLAPAQITNLRETRKTTTERDISLSLLRYMSVPVLWSIVEKNKALRDIFGFVSANQANKSLTFLDLRNRVSHPTNLLIASRDELKKINKECERLIEYGELIQCYLESLRDQPSTRPDPPPDETRVTHAAKANSQAA